MAVSGEGRGGLFPQSDSFGAWLTRRRKVLGLTREALARRVGYSAATIRKIEAEERRPSPDLAAALAELFGIPEAQRAAFVRFARGELLAAPVERGWAPQSRHVPPLPAATTSFIGRERDMATVRGYLADPAIRLVTLLGPPGIGKTRLALEVARELAPAFGDGVYFVPLAPLAPTTGLEQLARVAAHSLGLVERAGSADAERLQSAIGDRELLLFLDNAEHLVDALANLVASLLPACPRLNILCTSRESLRVQGEWLYPLPPLDLPEEARHGALEAPADFSALRLFAERARAVLPGFALTPENAADVAAICRELDGLPLAIELIAARSALLQPAELLARLSGGLALRADGRRGVPLRQKSLQDAIGWSYDLMGEAERQLFTGLSVFSGGFTVEAVEGVFGPEIDGQATTDLLASLLEKSLAQRIVSRSGEPRLMMLATIRQFAAAGLRERGDEAALRDRHLATFLDLAERAAPHIEGPEQVTWIDRLEVEFDNFRTAVEHGISIQDGGRVIRLLDAIAWPFFVRGYGRETREWLNVAVALPGADAQPLVPARLFIQMGRQSWLGRDFREAEAHLAQAETLAQAAGGRREMGYVTLFRGYLLRSTGGENRSVMALFEQALSLFEASGDQRGAGLALFNIGWASVDVKDYEQALSFLQQGLARFEAMGDTWGAARASHGLASLHEALGNLEEAARYYEQSLTSDQAVQFREGTANLLATLGNVHRRHGDYVLAQRYYDESRSVSRSYGLPWADTNVTYGLGMLALQQDDPGRAIHHFLTCLSAASKLVDPLPAADGLLMLAAATASANQPERAARLYGAGEAMLATLDYEVPAFDRAECERHMDRARAQLGEERFAALTEEGRRMTPEEAVATVMEA